MNPKGNKKTQATNPLGNNILSQNILKKNALSRNVLSKTILPKYKAQFFAVGVLKTFFAPYPDAYEISPGQILRAARRDNKSTAQNEIWLFRRLALLLYHHLVVCVYHENGGEISTGGKLQRVRLTRKGWALLFDSPYPVLQQPFDLNTNKEIEEEKILHKNGTKSALSTSTNASPTEMATAPSPAKRISRLAAMHDLKRLFASQLSASQLLDSQVLDSQLLNSQLRDSQPEYLEISLEQILHATGRQNIGSLRNRAWLSSRIGLLRQHGFVLPVYRYGKPRRLVGIRLTAEGQEALREVMTDPVANSIKNQRLEYGVENMVAHDGETLKSVSNPQMAVRDIARVMTQFKKENPQYEIKFQISLRK